MKRIIQIIKVVDKRLIALTLSIIGMFLRFKRLAGRDLWWDELCQMKYTLHPFVPIWKRPSTTTDLCTFPGEYLLNYFFVKNFYMNKWMTAIPHIIVTAVGFYLLYKICNKYFTTALGCFVTFSVVCFNFNLVYYSFEHRPYAVLPVLAVGCFYFIGEVFDREDTRGMSKRKSFFIGLFLFISTLYHIYGIVIVFLCLAFHILCRSDETPMKKIIKKNFLFFRNVAIFTAPFWLFYAGGILYVMDRDKEIFKAIVDTFQYIPNPTINFIGFAKGIVGNLLGGKIFYLYLLGFFSFFLPTPDRTKRIGFFLVMVVLPLIILLLLDLLTGWWFIQRHFIWVMPYFAILLGWNFDSLRVGIIEKN